MLYQDGMVFFLVSSFHPVGYLELTQIRCQVTVGKFDRIAPNPGRALTLGFNVISHETLEHHTDELLSGE